MRATSSTVIRDRFTRTSPDVLQYQVTVDSPETWTK